MRRTNEHKRPPHNHVRSTLCCYKHVPGPLDARLHFRHEMGMVNHMGSMGTNRVYTSSTRPEAPKMGYRAPEPHVIRSLVMVRGQCT
jgi:hypothetical protein